jgi:peptide/nickel transport system permease protein
MTSLAHRQAQQSRLAQMGGLVSGAAILAIILLASLMASHLIPYDPIEQNLRNTLQPPSLSHLFGTDNFGRDIFARVLHAAKLDLGRYCRVFWRSG